MYTRILQPEDSEAYRKLRIKAITEHPESFSSSFEELVDMPDFGHDRSAHFIVGAFSDSDQLIGIVGFKQESIKKFRHKGTIYGMYVDEAWQGQGIGRKLFSRLMERLERLTEIEQVNLVVAEDNLNAKRLYQQFGFTTYGLELKAMKLDHNTFVNGEYMRKQLVGESTSNERLSKVGSGSSSPEAAAKE